MKQVALGSPRLAQQAEQQSSPELLKAANLDCTALLSQDPGGISADAQKAATTCKAVTSEEKATAVEEYHGRRRSASGRELMSDVEPQGSPKSPPLVVPDQAQPIGEGRSSAVDEMSPNATAAAEVSPRGEPLATGGSVGIRPTEAVLPVVAQKEGAEDFEPRAKRAKVETGVNSEAAESAEAARLRRSSRERKTVQREGFVSEPKEEGPSANETTAGGGAEEEEGASTVVVKGRGTRLESIPAFVANFSSIKANSPLLRKLYRVLYAVPGKPHTRRTEILQWSGLPADGREQDLTDALLASCTLADLSEIGRKLFGISSGRRSTKQSWCEALTAALACPSADKVASAASAAAADTKAHAGSAKGRGGYQLFCMERREEARRTHPDANAKQLMKILGEEWRSLSEEQKNEYKARRPALSPAKRRRTRTRRSSTSEEEGPIGEEDDPEENADEDEC